LINSSKKKKKKKVYNRVYQQAIPVSLKAIRANRYNTNGVKYLKDLVNAIMPVN